MCGHFLRVGPTLRASSSAALAKQQAAVDARTAVLEPPEAHSSTVVVLHGLGDTALGWVDAAQHWQASMPNTRFVLPTATDIPVSLNFGQAMPAWYDLTGAGAREDEACAGLDESRLVIEEVLRREASALRGAATAVDPSGGSRIALVGFSQGGALSLFAGLQSGTPLAAVACLSGYLPRPTEVLTTLSTTDRDEVPPVLMAHGDADTMVLPGWARDAHARLEGAGLQVGFSAYPGLAHSTCIEELDEVSAFLRSRLPYSE